MVLANADREDSIRSVTLGLAEGRAVLAIGTDKGKIETYALGPTLARLGVWVGALRGVPAEGVGRDYGLGRRGRPSPNHLRWFRLS
jgi:hypothetical protein